MKKVMLFFAAAVIAFGVNAQEAAKAQAAKPADKKTSATKPADKKADAKAKPAAKPADKKADAKPATK